MGEQSKTIELSVDEALSKAKKAAKNKNLILAVELYQSVMIAEPQNPVAKKGLKRINATLRSNESIDNKVINPSLDDINRINSLVDSDNFVDAEAYCRTLLSKYPKSTFLFSRLSVCLSLQAKYYESLEYSEKLLLIDPQNVSGCHNYGHALMQIGRIDQGIEELRKASRLQKYIGTDNNKYLRDLIHRGELMLAEGANDWAILAFDEAISISSNSPEAFFHRGRARVSMEQYAEAFDDFGVASALDTSREEYLDWLTQMLDYVEFDHYNKNLDPFFIRILNRRDTDPSAIVNVLLHAIVKHEDLARALDQLQARELSIEELDQIASKISTIAPLLLLLEQTPLPDWSLEKLLVKLRCHMLIQRKSGVHFSQFESLAVSLAHQCYLNEYCYITTEEEEFLVDSLVSEIRKTVDLGLAPDSADLSLVGCYRPLRALNFISSVRHLLVDDKIEGLCREQIDNPACELINARDVKKFKPIVDAMSLEVASQYEHNPYPRWTTLPLGKSLDLERYIARYLFSSSSEIKYPTAPDVLIAGCGTGRQSIMFASSIKDSSLLAVDLSASSLGYAIRKTNEIGLKNIKYMQADILDLGELGTTFDVVECVGVLHHMKDPMAGWQVLSSLLKTDGLMHIALYSETARQASGVVSLRNRFKSYQNNASTEIIRELRAAVVSEISSNPMHEMVSRSRDFYTISGVRDLICHVNEYRFTVPKIKVACATLGLEFLGFNPRIEGISKDFLKCYPGDTSLNDLDMWEQYEIDNPHIFSSMYDFWLRKT